MHQLPRMNQVEQEHSAPNGEVPPDMFDLDKESHLAFFDDLEAPPPPSICEQLDVLAGGRRVAEQARVDNCNEPEAKIRNAMSMALYRYWVSVPW
jgi:hypothetical protein